MNGFDLDKAIRRVPNFPKKGIMFYDITSILTNPEAYSYVIEKMEEEYLNSDITGIVAVESRGFVFAGSLALKMKVPLLLARKKGKLPGNTISESYSLEYGEATLEMHEEDLKSGMNLLIVDDLIATGGTLNAVATMIEKRESKVAGIFSVVGLPFLNYDNIIGKYNIKTLINYDSE